MNEYKNDYNKVETDTGTEKKSAAPVGSGQRGEGGQVQNTELTNYQA